MSITRDQKEGKTFMKQKKYLTQVICRFDIVDWKPVKTRLKTNLKLKLKENEEQLNVQNHSLIGSLMHLAAYLVSGQILHMQLINKIIKYLSRLNTNYTEEYWRLAKRILKHINRTMNHGLLYKKSTLEIECFVNADWNSFSLQPQQAFHGKAKNKEKCLVQYRGSIHGPIWIEQKIIHLARLLLELIGEQQKLIFLRDDKVPRNCPLFNFSA